MGKGTPPRPLRDRFEARVVRGEGCWTWAGSHNNKGYAVIAVKGEDGRWSPRLCHRIAYELFVGVIPTGLVLDHTCRNTRCVNPAHLEPVTQQVNMLRGEHPSAIGLRRHTASGGTCAVDGCDEPIECSDLCNAHYLRSRRHGSPTGSGRKTLPERIADKSADQPDGCRLWTGATVNGYGVITVDRRQELAHRVVYQLNFGPIADGKRIGHRCGAKACVTPDHLREIA